ncbi:hypothetical protein [Nitrosopumilus sp.]|uniref:hypothetical protein n=1 Tax=Nitrosopumilus sp. TaxID=2024843 RepID=UPI003D10F60E
MTAKLGVPPGMENATVIKNQPSISNNKVPKCDKCGSTNLARNMTADIHKRGSIICLKCGKDVEL